MAEQPLIMIVEDHPAMHAALRRLMEKEGFNSLSAFTGPEALERFEAHAPDGVVLDLNLPGLDGFEVCRRLRARVGPRLPIVIVSSADNAAYRRRSREVGADAHFPKPFDPDKLIATIREFLAKAENPDLRHPES